MNEYDIRQLNVMLDKIHRFEIGKIYFNELIMDLEALLNVMEEPDTDWKEDFHSNWFTLEIYYALALDANKNPFELDVDGHIAEAIYTLKSMIYSELKKKSKNRNNEDYSIMHCDLEILKLMIDRINKIDHSEKEIIDIFEFMQDLKKLFENIKYYDETWKIEFQSLWVDLEMTCYVAACKKIPFDDLETNDKIFTIIEKLKNFVLQRVENAILVD